MLQNKVIECAAQIVYQSYKSVLPEDAFYMAIGEAEVEFDTDIDMKYTDEIGKTILAKAENLTK